MDSKKQYETPALVVYGSVEELTHGSSKGTVTDRTVPSGQVATFT